MCAIVEYPYIDKYEADPAANCPCVVEGSILAERNQLVQVLKRAVQNDQIEEFKVWK